MSVLVEDMLLLARLDQQRPLEQHTVDMLTLAADAVHDARVVAPDRNISLAVGSGAALLVIGDEVGCARWSATWSTTRSRTRPRDHRSRSGSGRAASTSGAPARRAAGTRSPSPGPCPARFLLPRRRPARNLRQHAARLAAGRRARRTPRPGRHGRPVRRGGVRGRRPWPGAHPGPGRARLRAVLPGRPGQVEEGRGNRPRAGHRGRAGGRARRRGVGRVRARAAAPHSASRSRWRPRPGTWRQIPMTAPTRTSWTRAAG